MKNIKKISLLASILFFSLLMVASAQMPGEPQVFTAALSGDDVVPAVNTEASGMVVAVLDGDLLVIGGNYEGLSSNVATQIRGGVHVHEAAKGENGGIVFELGNDGGTSGTFSGAFLLDEHGQEDFLAGNYYVQIHTENNNPGELRAQLAAM